MIRGSIGVSLRRGMSRGQRGPVGQTGDTRVLRTGDPAGYVTRGPQCDADFGFRVPRFHGGNDIIIHQLQHVRVGDDVLRAVHRHRGRDSAIRLPHGRVQRAKHDARDGQQTEDGRDDATHDLRVPGQAVLIAASLVLPVIKS